MEVNTGNTAVEAAEVKLIPIKKVAKSTKSKAIRTKSSHPPTSEMVNAAIKQLKDRKGSSLQAIKKYIATTYKIDGEKVAPFVKRYLKSAVSSGAVVQTKGKGASGSFKLSVSGKPSEVKPKVQSAKKAVAKKVPVVEKKTALAKKVAAPKRASLARKIGTNAKKTSLPKKVAAKPISPAKIKAKVETKSISKSRKSVKAPAAKTKTPKPKKVTASKALKAAKN